MSKLTKIILISIGLIIVAAAAVGLFYWQKSKNKPTPKQPSASSSTDIHQGYDGKVDPVPNDSATDHFNIVYQDEGKLKLDIYIPDTKANSYPLVIYTHGGGWSEGDKRSLDSKIWVNNLVDNGLAVASVNYRLYPEATYPAPSEDLDAAYKFLTANAAKYKLDMTKVGVLGTSAGGQISTLWAMKTNNANKTKTIKAIICLWTPTDLTDPAIPEETKVVINNFLGDPQKAAEASPVNYISEFTPPTLVAHGDKDQVIPYNQSVRFVAKLKEKGVKSRLIQIINGVHLFIDGSAQIRPTRSQLQKQMVTFYQTYLYK